VVAVGGAVVLVGFGVGVGVVAGEVGVAAVVAVAVGGTGVLVGIGVFVGVGVGGPGGGGMVVATKVGGGGGVLAAALVCAGARIAPATASIPTASGTVNPIVNRLFMQDSLRYAFGSPGCRPRGLTASQSLRDSAGAALRAARSEIRPQKTGEWRKANPTYLAPGIPPFAHAAHDFMTQ
jgi:hypothetical protein